MRRFWAVWWRFFGLLLLGFLSLSPVPSDAMALYLPLPSSPLPPNPDSAPSPRQDAEPAGGKPEQRLALHARICPRPRDTRGFSLWPHLRGDLILLPPHGDASWDRVHAFFRQVWGEPPADQQRFWETWMLTWTDPFGKTLPACSRVFIPEQPMPRQEAEALMRPPLPVVWPRVLCPERVNALWRDPKTYPLLETLRLQNQQAGRWEPITDAWQLSGYTYNALTHPALDIAAWLGWDVYAPLGGIVVAAGDMWEDYGNAVVIDHLNGYATLMAHLRRLNVRCGDVVYPGDVIGKAGATGEADGVHVHLEVWNREGRLDPRPFFPPLQSGHPGE